MREDKLFEIDYGYWFNLLNERIYRLLDVLINLVQLVGGSAAAVAAMGDHPFAVVASGFALSICAAISLLVQPSVRVEQHRACKAAWRKLCGAAAGLSDADLIDRVSELQSDGPMGLPGSDQVAWNKTVCARGQEEFAKPLGCWPGLLAVVG